MTALDICHAIVAALDNTVQMHVGHDTTLVTAGPNSDLGLFIRFGAFDRMATLAAALGIDKTAVEWKLATSHVWNGKAIVPEYSGYLIIHIAPSDVP
jgi:hypothetical protein